VNMNRFGDFMEPINLAPLLKAVLQLSKGQIAEEETANIGFSIRRAKEILKTLDQIRLAKKVGDKYELTDHGNILCSWIRDEKWFLIEEYLNESYQPYSRLKDVVKKWYEIGHEEGIPENELRTFEKKLVEEGQFKETLLKNAVRINFLRDWGERLGGVMENKLSNPIRLYLLSQQKHSQNEYTLLKTPYLRLAGRGLGEKYHLPIPWFREHACEFLRITRDSFDLMITTLLSERPTCIRLFRAPETTIAVKGPGIRRIVYRNEDIVEAELSPLYGLKVNNDIYYYVHLEVNML